MDSPEKEIWRSMGRPDFGKKRRRNWNRREPYGELFDKYHSIYYNYLMNILMSEFKYHNVPETLNVDGLEYSLRYYGYGSITAIDKDTIYIGSPRILSPGVNSVFGSILDNTEDDTLETLLDGRRVTQLTRVNYKTAKAPVSIIIPNKRNYYLYTDAISDRVLVDTTAEILAEIKAEIILNIRQQKTPFVGLTTDNSLTSKSVWQQLEEGKPFIAIDKDLADKDKGKGRGISGDIDLSKILQILPTQVPNLSAGLKDDWNEAIGEFLNQVGMNSVAVDKKERLLSYEAEANYQQILASRKSYLDARNNQLKLLNGAIGTNIYVTLNFDDAPEDEDSSINKLNSSEDDSNGTQGSDNDERQMDNQAEQDE